MQRECGDCQLCCKLLPVHENLPGKDEFHKGAGERCKHQRHHKGCQVYLSYKMPVACRMWNCRWLVNDDAEELSRPDRSHYVIDMVPDYVTAVDEDLNIDIPVVQVWVDPDYPDAHKDPALRRWMEKKGTAVIVRYNEKDAISIFPPTLTKDNIWVECSANMSPERMKFSK